MFLLRNFMAELPREVFESAYIDGASPVTAFFRLALPMSVPAIAALAIFQFLFVWNDLLVAFMYLGAVSAENLPMTVVDREPRQLARQRLAAAGCGGVHLDGRAVAGVLRAPALLRARYRRRVREGVGQGARAR